MAQIFKPAANTAATISLFGAAGGVFIAFLAGSQLTRSSFNTKVNNPINQPVPFSHQHHAIELGIDCRFCHSSVEVSPKATVPSTDVCMTCHSKVWKNSPMLAPVRASAETGVPIHWNKVNDVPDFVYFDHSIHINKGVSCNTCHGKIQDMHMTAKGKTLHMAWCLDCHRDPDKFILPIPEDAMGNKLEPREQVFELYRKLAAGDELTSAEHRIAEGLPNKAPDDEHHAAIKKRDIKVSQLEDCYICHR
jgi:ferredoxin